MSRAYAYCAAGMAGGSMSLLVGLQALLRSALATSERDSIKVKALRRHETLIYIRIGILDIKDEG